MNIIYLGFNAFSDHKRGVENVIEFQSMSCDFDKKYYIHWGNENKVYKENGFICFSINNIFFWPLYLNLIIFRIIKKNKTIIHSHNSLFSFFTFYITDILTVHDGLYYLGRCKKSKFKLFFYVIESLLYYKCRSVHFISDYAKKKSLFRNRKKFKIIPNTSHLESKFNIHSTDQIVGFEKQKTILVVRSIEERAKIDLIIELAKKLDPKMYNIIVVGKGPLLEYYRKDIIDKKIDNLNLIGYVQDYRLVELYRKCDLVLITAAYGEGFGLPVIEAYLFNKPVIASNRCAIPEIIISREYLFDNTVNSILKTIEFSNSQVDFRFRSYYNSKFSNALILSKMKIFYEEII